MIRVGVIRADLDIRVGLGKIKIIIFVRKQKIPHRKYVRVKPGNQSKLVKTNRF